MIHYGLLQQDVHALGIEALAVRHLEQAVEHIASDLRGTRLPGDSKMVSAACDFYIEAAFDLPQVFIELAAEIGQAIIVGGLENYVPRYLDCIQDWCFRPLMMIVRSLPRSPWQGKCTGPPRIRQPPCCQPGARAASSAMLR